MPRFEPRPPAESGSHLSRATKEILRRAGGRTGGLLFLIGEDRSVRSRLLREIGQLSEDRHLEVVRLRAFPQDACAPYGALLPWFAQWFRPTQEELRAPTALDHSFFTVMAGISSPGSLVGFSALAGFALDAPTLPREELDLPPAPGPSPSSPHPTMPGLDPVEMRTKLTELVHGRAQEAPRVVTIEGAENLDPASREWLSFLGGQLHGMPLVVVLSVDPRSPEISDWRRAFAKIPSTWERWPPSEGDEPPWAPRSPSRDAYGPDAAALVRAVRAAGPDATREVLLRALSWTEAHFDPIFRDLQQSGTLEEDGPLVVLSPGGGSAGPLLPSGPSGEATLHRALAEAIEACSSPLQGTVTFRLGEHWAEAGEVDRAVPLLSLAATEAERWGCPELAVARLERARRLLLKGTSPASRAALEKVQAQLGEVHHRASDSVGTVEAYERALALAQSRGAPPEVWGAYIPGLARARTLLGEDPEGLILSTLERLRQRSPDLEAAVWNVLGFLYRERGRVEEAAVAYEKACELVDQGQDLDLQARVHEDAATFYIFGGSDGGLDRACAHAQRVLSLARRMLGADQSQLRSGAFEVLSWVALSRQETQEAVEQGEACLQEARRAGFRAVVLEALGNQAEVQLECGRLDRARELAQELAEQCDRYALPPLDSNRQLSIFLEGRLALARGALEPARRHLEHVLSLSEVAGSQLFVGQALALLTVVAVERDDLGQARAWRDRLDREDLRKTLPRFTLRHVEELEPRIGQRDTMARPDPR